MKVSTEFAQRVITTALAQQREIARLQAEFDNNKALLANIVDNTSGRHSVEFDGATLEFTVSENNTYDEAAIRAALKPGQIARCEVRKLDKPTVKRLYPDAYTGAKNNRGVKVTL